MLTVQDLPITRKSMNDRLTAEIRSPANERIGDDEAHIIVLGNEKGGSGKSTTAMHVAVSLMYLGFKVGTIDLDARQGTLTRYVKNRWIYVSRNGKKIPTPIHLDIERSIEAHPDMREEKEREFLTMALHELGRACDFIVIDTPGSDSYLGRLAHASADTLITPMNDSLIDLDVLAHFEGEDSPRVEPSIYTQMVAEQNLKRIERTGKPMHWIVMRNRLSHTYTKNQGEITSMLEKMADQFGFQLVHGFGERVIFKELFPLGMTLMDLRALDKYREQGMTLSQVTARQEVRTLVSAISPYKARAQRKRVSA